MSSEPKLPTADLAPTGRAKCMQCGQAIPKGSVRISSAREPGEVQGYGGPVPGYLHPACAAEWATPRWVAGLEDFIEQVRAHSALSALPEPFGEAGVAARARAAAEQAERTPPFGSLSVAKVLSLAKKLAGCGDIYKSDRVIEKAGLEWQQRGPFRWHIARYGLVSPMHPAMLRGLAESVRSADTDAIFEVIPRMTASKGSCVLPDWPQEADAILMGAHLRDAPRLTALRGSVPELVRLGIGLVQGREGLELPEADRAAILDGLAACEASEYGLPRSYGLHGTRLVMERPRPGIEEAYSDLHELTRCFGDDAALAEALARHSRKASFQSLERVEEGLARLSLEELVQVLGRTRLSQDRGLDASLERLLRARADDPRALAEAALGLAKDSYGSLREPLLVHAMARLSEVPPGLEDEISWRDFGYCVAPWRKRPLGDTYRQAAQALGRERTLALVDRILDTSWDRGAVPALLGVHYDDARFRRLLALDKGENGMSTVLLCAVGSNAVPALVEWIEAAENPKIKATISQWLRGVLGCMGLAGEAFEPSLDTYLSINPELSYWSEEERTITQGMLAGMTLPRQIVALDRLISEGKHLERLVGLLPADPGLRGRAAAAVVRGFAGTRDPGQLSAGLRSWGATGLESFRELLLAEKPDPKLFELLGEAFGREPVAALQALAGVAKETPLGRLFRLAAAASGPKERIYLLERVGWDEATPPRRAGSLSVARAAGPSLAGQPDHEHVLTLDLHEIPELQARFPDSLALSLYAPDIEGGSAWDDAELVAGGAAEGGEPIVVVPLELPSAVFDHERAHADPALAELRKLVFNRPGWVLGGPMFIQDGEEGSPGFVMQLAEQIGGLNLGDSGSLYVYESGSFMQCF